MGLELILMYSTGGICALSSAVLSIHLLFQHLCHFALPDFQRYICRILLMVPIYALTSWLSMMVPKHRDLLNILRDFYEAFVIYSFTILLMNYVGGERKLAINLELKDYIHHPWPMRYIFRSFQPGKGFLRLVKAGTLQFVFCRPLLSGAGVLLSAFSLYHDSYFGFDDGYLYIFMLNNLSFSAALYGLLLFFTATEELLEPFSPVPKFLCVKLVIFFSFWQGILLMLLEHFGVIGSTGGLNAELVSVTVQEYLICLEMLAFSIAHCWAFGVTEFIGYPQVFKGTCANVTNGIKAVFLAEDVIKEVKDSIAPKKYDFELDD